MDVLAHPGAITAEDARHAAANGVFLELSAWRGHSLANGHIARQATATGARLLVDSDAHGPEDLLTEAWVQKVAKGAGLEGEAVRTILEAHPRQLLAKPGYRLAQPLAT